MGVKTHFNTRLEAFLGDGEGRVRGVRTSRARCPPTWSSSAPRRRPATTWPPRAGLRSAPPAASSSTSGWPRRPPGCGPPATASSAARRHQRPAPGLPGSHAYAQGKVAGTNAAGGSRNYQPVYVPWGLVAGKWMIGGVSFGETLATALGIPYVLGKAKGISRARYYPDMKKVTVKLLAEPGSLRLIGAQMVGGEGIKERADFLAMAVKIGITLTDLAFMENVYSPPIGALNEPIALAAQNGLANLKKVDDGTPGAGDRRSPAGCGRTRSTTSCSTPRPAWPPRGARPPRPRGAKEMFWRRVFAPTYRRLPWKIRLALINRMPGSHRQNWTPPAQRRNPAI